MALNRRDALAGLATLLGQVTEVKTVVRSMVELDITQYTQAQLPLVMIREPAESVDDDLTSRRQIINLGVSLKVWFVLWGEQPATAYETLVKKIRNKVGANFVISNTAIACWVTSISNVDGSMPLYWFEMGLNTKLYLDETDV